MIVLRSDMGRREPRDGIDQQRDVAIARQAVIAALDQRHLHVLARQCGGEAQRSEEHTSELQSLMRISYAVFCLKKKITTTEISKNITRTADTRTPTQ